jgi:ribA/ribD-fused uncharacterized protein
MDTIKTVQNEPIPRLPQEAVIHDRQTAFEDEILQWLEKQIPNKPNKEKFAFFWKTVSPFSQWHRCKFTGKVIVWGEQNELKEIYGGELPFVSAEQYMMFQKAILFSDEETAEKILETRDARRQKALGKQVKHFNESTWEIYRAMIVAQGNVAKFTQNPHLKRALIATKGKTLVEAAPNDRIWGIGLHEDDPRSWNRQTWQGENLLGFILTWLRIQITGSYPISA